MKLLLLVQNESDVAHLDAASKAILNSAITGVWVVFSPAITVNASEAAAKLDAEIAQLREAYRQSIEREDLDAAKGYKAQREGKELDRAKAIVDAWKSVGREDRVAKIRTIFDSFQRTLQEKGVWAILSMCNDHYDADQFIAMLNSFSARFKNTSGDPKTQFTPRSFSIAWPETVEMSLKLQQATPQPPPPTQITKEQQQEYDEKSRNRLPKVQKATLSRAEELATMKHFSLVGVAKKLGIETDGKIKTVLIEEIVKKETDQVPEPALAEY